MSNIVSIDELRKEFLEKQKPKDIKEFVHKQQELLEKYMQQVKNLEEKLAHSDLIIQQMGKNLAVMPTDEEIVCLEQIKYLKDRSEQRELDVNDIKKFDLLVKNLRLIRSQATEVFDTSAKDLTAEELIGIATETK